MRVRMALLAVAVCAAVAAAPATAGAQEPARLTKVVPVTGKSKSGKKFTGTYTIDRFKASGGRVLAVGIVRGRLGDQRDQREDRRGARGRQPARQPALRDHRAARPAGRVYVQPGLGSERDPRARSQDRLGPGAGGLPRRGEPDCGAGSV